MAKRQQAPPPSDPPPKRQTRSSGPSEQSQSLPLGSRSNNKLFQLTETLYTKDRKKLWVRRRPKISSLQTQSVAFDISDHLSLNDDERNTIVQDLKSKVRERITVAEGAVAGRELNEDEFESVVRKAGEEVGLGTGDAKRGLTVPKLEESVNGRPWKVVTDGRSLGSVDEKDFQLDVITNQRLETSVPPTQRSTSYERAISSSNNIALRGLSLLTALSSLAADERHPRADSRWNETFLLEVNKYRKPLRKIIYNDHVKISLRIYSYGAECHCRLRQAGVFTEAISFGPTTDTRSAEVVDIYEGLMELQESGELSWEEVKRAQEEWKAGIPPRPGMSAEEELRLESKAESSPMSERVKKSVKSATARVDQYRGASFKHRETLTKHIVRKYVSTEVVNDNAGGGTKKQRMETIRNCLTGEPLLSLPASGTVREVREWVANSGGLVSIDHFDQIVIGLVNGEVIPVMNSKLNLGPVSLQLNQFKYRWPCSLLLFMFAGISISDGTNGVVNENESLLEAHSRLLKLSKASYKCHRIPCPRNLRSTLPVARIKDVILANTRILELLGVNFATPLPTFDDYLEQMGITAEDFDEFANEQLQQMSDEEFLETGAQLDIDSNPPVRPGGNLNNVISPGFEEQIRKVSESLDRDSYNMVFNKTREGEGSGIIALTSHGTESVHDLCRLLLKTPKAYLQKNFGCGGENPGVTVYANSICFVAHSILVKRQYGSFDASTKVFFHDPINPGLPLDLPPDSKHPLMPSISSNDHPQHRHGWKAQLPVIGDLTFKGWSASRNTMRLATAASNLGDGQGNSTEIMHNRESLRKSIEFFRNIPETGYDSFLETLFDPSPAGKTFVDSILAGVNDIDASRTAAPPPSDAARTKRMEKANAMEEDEGD